MAATPNWKIVNPQGEYVASCKHLEDASFLVAALGKGTKVYDGQVSKRQLIWTEGADGNAGDSADGFADLCCSRVARSGTRSLPYQAA